MNNIEELSKDITRIEGTVMRTSGSVRASL